MKKILPVIVSALILCSSAACADGGDSTAVSKAVNDGAITIIDDTDKSSQGSETDNTDTSSQIDEANLPSKVYLRDYDGKNYVTAVKRQAFGDCWSFGIAAAAESSYLYANDLGIPVGELNDEGLYKDNGNVNFSEKYLSWYVYHRITEEDVTPGKIRASQVGEGYNIDEAEGINPNVAYIMGGALTSGINMFASGFGPVEESVTVNGAYPYSYTNKNIPNDVDYEDYSQSGDWSISLNSEYRNAPISAYLRNGNLLPNPASTDAEGNYIFNENGVRAIKSEIANGRAVAVTALVFGRMNYDNWAAYSTDDNRNHVVTIIGYDDNY